MAVALEAVEFGDGEPVAILHGLFGSGRNWATIAQRLATTYRVIAFDLRNHGGSPWAEAMGYRDMAEDVHAAMQARGYQRYALIGHSMGGKASMVAALLEPRAVEKLVVVDIAPVTYSTSPYRAYVQAMRALDLGAITRRREADAQLADTVHSSAERAFLLQNLVFDDGATRWRINLAALEPALPALAGFPAMPAGTTYERPALFVAGGKSASLRPEHEGAVTALFPTAMIVRIAEAGHWLHADAPDAFLALVEPFLGTKIFSDAD
jgi:esterase